MSPQTKRGRGVQLLVLLWIGGVNGSPSFSQVASSSSSANLTSSEEDNVASKVRHGPTAVQDCSDLPYGSSSGVYLVLEGAGGPVPAYCDMDDGAGWTVFQRRADIQPRQDFYLGWEDYKAGFGDLHGEFWWGLENMFRMTSLLGRRYELMVELADWEGNSKFAYYDSFSITSEVDFYRMSVRKFTGNAGNSLDVHDGMQFSTKDSDHDFYSGSCSHLYHGAWWYHKCYHSNLNGDYRMLNVTDQTSIRWVTWDRVLMTTVMKIRPTD